MSRQRGRAFLIGLCICIVAAALAVSATARFGTPELIQRVISPPAPQLTVDVGPETYIAGPIDNYLDSRLVTAPDATVLRGYSAGTNESYASTYDFSGSNLDALALPTPHAVHAVLDPGPQGSYDECGAWLQAIYEVTASHWIGWYHAEHGCDYTTYATHMSMAFAESFDGGKTWQKSGYPRNQILTAPAQYSGSATLDQAGDGSVVASDGYLYNVYVGANQRIYVARATIASEGKPGMWHKYYQGSFDQPGIGGQQTPIGAAPGVTDYDTYLHAFVNIEVTAQFGFRLNVSAGDDATRWSPFANIIYPYATYVGDPNNDKWFAGTSPGQIYNYPALISPDGDSSEIGQAFYLYYLKVYKGGSLNGTRYLFRRLVTLRYLVAPTYDSVAELAVYAAAGNRSRVSTQISLPAKAFRYRSTLGKLLTYQASGFHALYECIFPATGDEMLDAAGMAHSRWQTCGLSSSQLVRNIGFAADQPGKQANVALYECFERSSGRHVASTDPRCGGQASGTLLGYIFPPSFLSESSPSPVG